MNLYAKDFLKLQDFTKEELLYLLDLAAKLKKAKREGTEVKYLQGKNIALIFEKDSTRTRCAFEVAAFDQGAHTTYLASGTQIGKKESIADTARVLSTMYEGIEYRGFGQDIVEELARYASVPVWNGLTDEAHPTQVLADMLTVMEHSSKPLNEVNFAYFGDARNNMCNSLLIGSAILGVNFRIAAPKSLQPSEAILAKAYHYAKTSGADLVISDMPELAIKQADFVYTDVWVSMGEPKDVWQERIELLLPYQVNTKLMSMCQNANCKFLHCLPAFHNTQTTVAKDIYQDFGLEALEVTEEVFESPNSIVFEQAENRLHTIKAVMVATLAKLD